MNFEGTFNLSLTPEESGPVAPFSLDVNLMGAIANLANIKTDKCREENGKLMARITISKGTALSDEFWEANGGKIAEYIQNNLIRIRQHE